MNLLTSKISKYKSVLPFLLLMVYFQLFRLVFNWFNQDMLSNIESFKSGWQIYWVGAQYDWLVLALFNLPFLGLILLLPFINYQKIVVRFIQLGLLLVNSCLIIVSVADIPYFRFNNRRATSEVFQILGDSASAFGSFFLKYWYFVVLVIILIFLFFLVVKYSFQSIQNQKQSFNWPVTLLIVVAIPFVVVKGKQLTPKHASLYVSPEYRSLVTNTPITLLYSLLKGQEQLNPKQYFTDDELKQYFKIHHNYSSNQAFQTKNVVLFVLESFSQEYLIPGHPNKAPTPFLDSLMSKSIVFENMYANGATSAYGLMSILGGIPPFLNEAYFATIYGDNDIYGIGSLLNEYGYTSSFFYGAEDDHYGFRKNMTLLGIDNYFSEKDYKGDGFDGNWGIYDEPFMQLAAETIIEQEKPVFATIFNISSHLPYMVPDELKDVLPKGSMSSHQSLAYVDYAIKQFFKRLEQDAMFDNTIFLFVADHWAKRRDMEFKNDVGRYRIPFFIYDPQVQERKTVSSITQQLDVMPTLLQYLKYNGPWMSFGEPAILQDSSEDYRFTFNEYENVYQIIDSTFVLAYDETREQSFSMFNYKSDPDLTQNLLEIGGEGAENLEQKIKMENYIKAIIQTYNQHLLENDVNILPKE